MPPLVHLGPAAPSGVMRYKSQAFGPQYRDNLFTACFNMRKVTRHVLTPRGASYTATTEDFLISNSIDFHPTDVIEDADGSLIVIDTGGWYKICCPTSQLWKPDILGAIYRIRRKDVPRTNDPRGLKIAWVDASAKVLCDLMGEPRPVVRQRAIDELAKRGPKSLSALEEALGSPSTEIRRNAVWVLTRLDVPEARLAVRGALSDSDATVRQAAVHSISVWRDRAAVPQLVALLGGHSAANERAAAEALGRIGERSAVPALLAAAGHLDSDRSSAAKNSHSDRNLEHSLTYALIEIDDPTATRAALGSDRSGTRRAALIAVDQMQGGGVQPEKVAPLLASADPVLKETAAWTLAHHADWGTALAGWLDQRVCDSHLSPTDLAELEQHLSQFAAGRPVQKLLAATLGEATLPVPTRRAVLHAMRDSGLREMPPGWAIVLTRVLNTSGPSLVADAVATVRALPSPKKPDPDLKRALLQVADNRATTEAVRLEALAAVPGGLSPVSSETFAFLLTRLDADLPVITRSAAADVLSKAKLDRTQLARLAETLATTGPLEASRLLAAFETCDDEAIGLKLLTALKASPSLTALRIDWIAQRIKKQPANIQAKAEELYQLINVDIGRQRERIEQILPMVSHASVRRGQIVFAGSRVACMSCHQFGAAGGQIGPDLTKIGAIRSERDLLEAIMFPSASFVRSFEPMQVVTRSGKVFNGLVRKDATDEIVLVASATETVHVPREEVEEVRPGTVSVMPAGLDKQLTVQEVADLVAFLSHAKSKNVQ